MSTILKKWGYRERMSQAAGNSRDERATLLKISQNHELRDSVHTDFERFMILAREETARMSAEVKHLFALSVEAAAKLEALDREEAELMAAANMHPPNQFAAVDAVALAASGTPALLFIFTATPHCRQATWAPLNLAPTTLPTPPNRPFLSPGPTIKHLTSTSPSLKRAAGLPPSTSPRLQALPPPPPSQLCRFVPLWLSR